MTEFVESTPVARRAAQASKLQDGRMVLCALIGASAVIVAAAIGSGDAPSVTVDCDPNGNTDAGLSSEPRPSP